MTLFACRPENTEICPPRISRYSLSWLDTASIRPLAARGGTIHQILHRSLRIEVQLADRYHSAKTGTVQGNLRRIGDVQDAVDSARNDGPDNLGTAEVFIFFGHDTPVQHVHIIRVLHQKF